MRPRSRLSSQPLLPVFSSTSGGLSPYFHSGWLPPVSLRGRYGGWAKTQHTLFTPTFLCFPIFPLLLNPKRHSTFEWCLLELLFNNNNMSPVSRWVKKKRLTIQFLWVIGSNWMVQGNWVGDPLRFFLFYFLFCSSSPLSASIVFHSSLFPLQWCVPTPRWRNLGICIIKN